MGTKIVIKAAIVLAFFFLSVGCAALDKIKIDNRSSYESDYHIANARARYQQTSTERIGDITTHVKPQSDPNFHRDYPRPKPAIPVIILGVKEVIILEKK